MAKHAVSITLDDETNNIQVSYPHNLVICYGLFHLLSEHFSTNVAPKLDELPPVPPSPQGEKSNA